MKRAPVIAALLLLLSAGACGFQLRGDLSLPAEMASTYVDYDGGDGDMLRTVVRALTLSKVDIARSEAAAGAILHLPSAVVARRLLLKDVEGRPREYELTVTLQYSVTTPDGVVLVPAAKVERRSNLALDPSDPLGNAGDVARAVESLREDAVWDMLNRIAAAQSVPVPEAE